MGLCVTNCQGLSADLGVPAGVKPFSIPVGLIVVPLFAEDGTEFSIDTTSVTMDQTTIDDYINETDKTKRMYPIIGLKNVESVKAENNLETFNDGDIQIISEGVRNFKAVLPSTSRQYLGQLKNLTCSQVGVYMIDSCGNFLGRKVGDLLKPKKVALNTWSAILMWATDSTGQNTDLTFNFAKTERDENDAMIIADSITADLSSLSGLIDVTFTNPVGDSAAKTLVVDAATIYGGMQTTILREDLVLGDFTATLNGGAEVIVSTPNVDGTYTITFTSAIIVTDIIVLSATKTGLDISDLTFTYIA